MRRLLVLLLSLSAWLPLSGQAADVLSREEFSLSRFADAKLVYLDFWASWCVPCRHSFPWLNAMQKKYADRGLVIVGVNVDPDRADADRFLAAYPADFTLVMDPAGELAEQWRLQGMPSAVIIDASGQEVHRHIGFRADRTEDYENLIVELLHRADAAPQDQTGEAK